MNVSSEILYPLALFIAILLIGNIFGRWFFAYLKKHAERTGSPINNVLINALKHPFSLWVIVLGLLLSSKVINIPPNLDSILDKLIFGILIVSFTLVAGRIGPEMVKIYADKLESTFPLSTLTQNIVKIAIFIIGGFVLLDSFGISIAPLLTALGIGGLAVALALQPTISNLFSGLYLLLSKGVRVGDYIALDSGQEGYILDIGWRATRIKTLPNNIILIPNSKISDAIITNHFLLEREMAVLVQVGVDYRSDLRKVEEVTVEVAKEIMETVPGGVKDFNPFIRYHTFGESSINFTVILRAREFVDQYLIKHEFVKKLKERYDKEGIIIPFPIRTLYLHQSPN